MEIPTIDKKKLSIIAGGLLGVLILLVSLTALISNLKKRGGNIAKNTKQEQQAAQSNLPQGPTPLPLPKVEVAKWVAPNSIPQAAASSQIYTFKQVNPEQQAAYFSQRIMGSNKLTKSKKGLFIATLGSDTGKDLSAFVYNPGKGEFSYASTRGILLPGGAAQTTTERVGTLVNLIFSDPTLKVTAEYKRKDKPGLTYYEIHREWGAVGLPILNPLGLLNLPENQSLTSLRLAGTVGKGEDSNIFATTDASDGKARATDFNSMTVAVKDDDHTVASLISNIREVERSQLKLATIISYESAIEKLKNKQYSLLYTSPSGDGVPNFDKVYPGNEGVAEQAEVKEGVVTYLEDVPSNLQKTLSPYYVFRGNTTLKSGYRVNFIAAVPATEGGSQGSTLGVSSPQRTGSQSQGSYTISPQPTLGSCGLNITCPSPTVTPRPPTPTPTFGTHCGLNITCPPSPTPLPPSLTPTLPPPCCITVPPPTVTPRPPTPTPGCGFNCPTPTPPPPTVTPPPPPPTATPRPPTPTPPCTYWWQCLPTFPPVTITPGCGTNCPTPTPPPPTVTPPPTTVCIPAPNSSDLTNRRTVSSNLYTAQLTQSGLKKLEDNYIHHGEFKAVGDWYAYSTGPGLTADDIVKTYELIKNSCGNNEQGKCNERLDNAISEIEEDPGCPVRITGGSPTLFVYGAPGQTMTITPQSTVNYAEPGLTGKAWNITTGDNGTVAVNGTVRDYLYYEYKPITFTRPSTGWTVKKENLESLITTLAQSLELNAKEEERLNFEITQAASNVSGDTLFIGLIDKQEVNTKLPLSVTPHIPVQRIHFYVGEANASVLNPHLTPLIRTSSLVLEIGAGGK